MMTGARIALAGLAGSVWLAVVVLANSASAQVQPTAAADIRDRLSRLIGTASFHEESGGVHVTSVLRNLPAGPHGLHIDNVGRCSSPTFLSAGTIFNPTGKQHGLHNAAGPQVGDLPTLMVAADGTATLDAVARGATLSSGPTSLLGGNGTALVIHGGDDDQVTDPEGNAGERVACGVILPGDSAALSATAQSRGPFAVAATPVQPASALPAGVEQTPAAGQRGAGPMLGSPLLVAMGLLLVGAGYLLRRRRNNQ